MGRVCYNAHRWIPSADTSVRQKLKKRGNLMKTVAKVFIIIGMIFQCYMIFPLILGIIALKKLNKAEKKDDFGIGWGVVVLIFVNLIAGIVLLCMNDENYADGKKPEEIEE